MDAHIPTMLLVTVVVNAALATTVAVNAHRQRRDGMWLWACALAAHTVAYVLIGLRGRASDVLSVVVANIALASALALFYEGILQFQGRPRQPVRTWAPVLTVAALFSLFLDNFQVRVAACGLIDGGLALLTLLALAERRRQTTGRGQYLVGAGMGLMVAFGFARAAAVLLGQFSANSILAPSPLQAATFIATTLGLVMTGLGVLLMVKERSEAALADALAELQRLRDALDQVPLPVFIKDRQLRYVYGNDATLSLLQRSAAAIKGASDADLYAPETAAQHAEIDAGVLAGQASVTEVESADDTGQRRVFIQSKAPIYADADRREVWGLCGIFTDITARTAAEAELESHRNHLNELVIERTRELAAARDDAESANRAKTAFLANMSHEVRTPLNQVLGFANLLHQDVTNPRALDRIDKIVRASHQLLATFNGVLDFAKLEAGRLELHKLGFGIGRLLDQVARRMGEMTRARGIALHCEVAPGVPARAVGDSLRLEQVLVSLVDNAVKFSDGGQVSVRVQVQEQVGDTVTLHFEVADQGPGLTPEQITNLFQPFQQGDPTATRRHRGIGLGLALCKRLTALMAGELGCTSTPGRGATFWFRVPLGVSVSGAVVRPDDPREIHEAFVYLTELLREGAVEARQLWRQEAPTLSAALPAHGHDLGRAIEGFEFDRALHILGEAVPQLGPTLGQVD
ncbi:MAG: PAS domain-containing protein [Deltaproteobacteria bacterium]|nr:PAS domain-containing protein [Deltaproteobacteria bacterium]